MFELWHFFSNKSYLKSYKIYFWNAMHWRYWINFQNVILVCTEEKNHFLSTADAVFKMWQFWNYKFGIGENVAWIAHVLAAQFFYSKNSHSSNMPHALFHSRIRGGKNCHCRSVNLRVKFWCLQISQKANQIFDRFLP